MSLRHLLSLSTAAIAVFGCAPSLATSAPLIRSHVSRGQPRVATPLPGTYVAMGASETFGVGASPFKKGYAYLVARAIHARRFRDVGIPGATLSDAYDTELQETLAMRPALVTAFFGYNDIAAHVPLSAFLRDLHDMALTLRLARSRVLIIGLPDLTLVPSAARLLRKLHLNIHAWNVGMRGVARATGAAFLDLTAFARELAHHPGYISADGLHPSNKGHARLAQVVEAAIHRDGLWKSS